MAQVSLEFLQLPRDSAFPGDRRLSAGGFQLKRRRCRLFSKLFLFVLLFYPDRFVEAGKLPFGPEELQQQSELIVVGKVRSHYDLKKANKDGSETTHIYLKVQVLKVEKGTGASEGETIDAGCWVVTKAPRQGTLWDTGHSGIPDDGGEARFFLQLQATALWNVIYPNGIERLDDGPTLNYPMGPPDPAPSWGLAVGVGGTLFFLATITFTWLFLSRPQSGKSP